MIKDYCNFVIKMQREASANSIPKQRKPIFRIINTKMSTSTTWTLQECMELIRGIQEKGAKWRSMCSLIPTKSKEQIEAQGQRFLEKIENIHGDALEFIKSNTPTVLIDYFDDIKNYKKNIEIKSEGKKLVEEPVVQEQAKRASIKKKKKIKNQRLTERNNQVVPEAKIANEENKIPQEYIQSYPHVMPQVIMPYPMNNIIGRIYDVRNNLNFVDQNLEAEKSTYKEFLEKNEHFKNRWEALEKCTESLKSILYDIYFIHVNGQGIQQQMIQPQFYYTQEALRPRFNYSMFEPEEPRNNE